VAYLPLEGSRRIGFEHFSDHGVAIVLVHRRAVNGRYRDDVLPTLPASGRQVIAALRPNAQPSVYPNCRHAPFPQARTRYSRELTTFITAL
jgi:hypothetical protein